MSNSTTFRARLVAAFSAEISAMESKLLADRADFRAAAAAIVKPGHAEQLLGGTGKFSARLKACARPDAAPAAVVAVEHANKRLARLGHQIEVVRYAERELARLSSSFDGSLGADNALEVLLDTHDVKELTRDEDPTDAGSIGIAAMRRVIERAAATQ